MLRLLLLCLSFSSTLYAAHASAQSDPDWQTVQYRSQAWVWGWTALDITSMANNWRLSQESDGKARRTRAQAEGIRATLGLWSVWKNQPAYFSLNGAPTEAQKQAQIKKANEYYHFKNRIPNLVVNLALSAWVMQEGDDRNAAIVMASGIFWGEVSLLTQRMLDTDWHWRVQDDQLQLSYLF